MPFRDLDHFPLLLFILSLQLNTTCETSNPDYKLFVQRTISVQKGLCVYIPCTFTVAQSNTPSATAYGIWYIDKRKRTVVTSQNFSLIPLENRGRIFFTGDAFKYDCSMSINDVQSSDGNKYYLFRLEDARRSYSYTEYTVYLSTALTDKPEITPVGNLLAGKEVTLTCQSPGRCNGSAPLITWTGGIQGENVTDLIVHANGTKTYYSNITFTPSREHNQLSLTCNVNFQASSARTLEQITLNVEYTPNVTIKVGNFQNENTAIIVMEGKSETIICTVDSNPQSTITWYKEDKALNEIPSGNSLTYIVNNANLSDAGIYRCSANNTLSTTNRSIAIIVYYAPRPPQIICFMPKDCRIDGNKTIHIKEGSSLSLRCSAKSLPAATLSWLNPGNPKNISLADKILFPNILHSDDGLYTCQANNTYGSSNASVTIKVTLFKTLVVVVKTEKCNRPHFRRKAPVLLLVKKHLSVPPCKGPADGPRAVEGKSSTCKEAENHIECTCLIESFPYANIQWKINEKSYTSSENDVQISTSRINAETNSTLILHLNQKGVQSIECISSNFVQHLLSKQSNSSWRMVAAVSVVLVVATLLGIAFIMLQYRRRRKLKQESKDIKELHSNSHDVIYSNTSMFCNHAESSQEIPQTSLEQDDGTIYMNCGEVQYASINFSKLKPNANMGVIEPETDYASIKPQ
ncbi:sialic acid-binding Ig-like lectin 16 [Mantella aurantiaca]